MYTIVNNIIKMYVVNVKFDPRSILLMSKIKDLINLFS